VLNIIKHIRSDNGKKFKVQAIKEHADNELFKQVLLRTYSPLIRYGISLNQVPEFTHCSAESCMGLEKSLSELDKLSNRELTGYAARDHLGFVLSNTSEEVGEILLGIIDKSLKLGCNASSINSAIKKLIPETPYQGAVSYDEKKVAKLFAGHDCVSQQKADGRFTNVAINEGVVTLESRQGLPTNFQGTFDSLAQMEADYGSGLVLQGEMLVSGFEKDRYTSNGMISSLVTLGDKIDQEDEGLEKDLSKFEKRWGMTYRDALSLLRIELWDFIPMDIYLNSDTWEIPYSERMNTLNRLIDSLGSDRISFIESREVKNETEARRHFVEQLNQGNEGTILKSKSAFWKDGKPVTQVKYKAEITLDLKLVGANKGTATSKNANVFSSMNVQSSDGLLQTSPGGLKEAEMRHLTEELDSLIGSIVTVKCNGLSTDKEGRYSLLHPVFESFRDDKAEADSLEQCIAIHKASLALDELPSVHPGAANTPEKLYNQTNLL
jgi:hypothetical protein